MKFANISKATRVPASLKFAALAAILLVPASAFAETDPDGNVQSQTKSTVRPKPFNPDAKKPLRNSISFKAFYGLGLEPPIRNSSLPEVNISGLTFEYARSLSENLEFVVASNIGYGSRDYGRWEVFACSVEWELGMNFVAPLYTSAFYSPVSFFIGPRLGADFLAVKVDDDYSSNETKTELGLLFGADCGAVFSFDKQSALVVGVGYRRSTSKPFQYMEDQSWLRFSVGYRFSF